MGYIYLKYVIPVLIAPRNISINYKDSWVIGSLLLRNYYFILDFGKREAESI